MELFELYSFRAPEKKENIYYHKQNLAWNVKHKCTYWEFLVIKKGIVLNSVNDQVHAMFCNDIAFIRPNDLHTVLARGNQPFEYINLMIDDEYVKKILDYVDGSLYEEFTKGRPICYSFSTELIHEIDQDILKADQIESDDEKQVVLKPLMLKLIATFIERRRSRESGNGMNVIRQIVNAMQQKKNIQLSIKEICRTVGYSQGYVTRCFGEQGMLPNAVFRQIKLNFARTLLEESDLSILEISREVGLSGINYFNKRFFEQFGILPTEYRRQNRKDRLMKGSIQSMINQEESNVSDCFGN